MTPAEGPDDADRDAYLREALRHAPDADLAAPGALSDVILRQARMVAAALPASAAALQTPGAAASVTPVEAPQRVGLAEPPAAPAWVASSASRASPPPWGASSASPGSRASHAPPPSARPTRSSRAPASRFFGDAWRWLARPPVAAGFASVMAATLVGLMWWDQPMDTALRPPAPAQAESRAHRLPDREQDGASAASRPGVAASGDAALSGRAGEPARVPPLSSRATADKATADPRAGALDLDARQREVDGSADAAAPSSPDGAGSRSTALKPDAALHGQIDRSTAASPAPESEQASTDVMRKRADAPIRSELGSASRLPLARSNEPRATSARPDEDGARAAGAARADRPAPSAFARPSARAPGVPAPQAAAGAVVQAPAATAAPAAVAAAPSPATAAAATTSTAPPVASPAPANVAAPVLPPAPAALDSPAPRRQALREGDVPLGAARRAERVVKDGPTGSVEAPAPAPFPAPARSGVPSPPAAARDEKAAAEATADAPANRTGQTFATTAPRAEPKPRAAPALPNRFESAPGPSPLRSIRASIEAAPARWSWQRAGADAQPMNPALERWVARFDGAATGWVSTPGSTLSSDGSRTDEPGSVTATTPRSGPASTSGSVELRLWLDGRLQATLAIDGGAARVTTASGAHWQAALPPGAAAALQSTFAAGPR